MFLDRVIDIGETFGDQVKGRSPTKLKPLIEVSNVVHMKAPVLIFKILLISSQYRVLKPIYPFLTQLCSDLEGSSPKKIKILIAIP